MKLKYTLAAFAALTVSANAAIIYSSDFQSDAIGATPADWSGNIRVFSGAGATTEGGTNDRAIIALTGTDMSAILDLGQVGVLGDTISVNLDVAQYASSGTSVVTYSLGTVTGGGVFTAFAEAAVTEATSGARSWPGTNTETAGAVYTHVFNGTDLGDNLALQVTSVGSFGGVDSVVVDVTPVPEPSSTALLGLGGLALILRRRK